MTDKVELVDHFKYLVDQVKNLVDQFKTAIEKTPNVYTQNL